MKDSDKIKKDFDHELSVNQFPFHEIVTNPNYLSDLYKEFSLLIPKPKFRFYFNEFISDEEWAKDRLENRGHIHTYQSSEIVAANFVAMSDLEIKANELHRKFIDMEVKGNVDEKYKGRLISDMGTYMTLAKIDQEFDSFKKYVLNDSNVGNYGAYARASAKKIINHVNTLGIEPLKIDLFEHFLRFHSEEDFKFLLWISTSDNKGQTNHFTNFSYLKAYADELFQEALNAKKDLSTGSKFTNSKYASFSVGQLIAEGEGKFIEFKRTIIINPDTKLVGNKQKHAIAKTIAAFLNTGGGALIVGLTDSGDILGLDDDFNDIKDSNKSDGLKKRFDDLMSRKLGNNYNHLINLEFDDILGKIICIIRVDPSNEPVYCLDEANKSKELYVRRQTSTVALKTEEVNPFIKSRFSSNRS